MIEQAASISVSAAVRDDLARIESTDGPQRLKNEIERAVVGRWVHAGDRVLDAGIGAGRIGLALDLGRVRLTGLDASPAMLDQCRRSAGSRAEFIRGDLRALPFADASFDSVVSIDAFSQLASWRDNLTELLRVTRLGGRVIVDAGCADHVDAVTRRRGWMPVAHDARAAVVSIDELAEFARQRGVTVRAIVPYGALLGGLVPNGWLAGADRGLAERLERLVSWTGTDEKLFACAAFIEQRIIGELTPHLGARMLLVFERDANARPAPDELERVRRIASLMLSGELSLAETAARHPGGCAAFAVELTQHFSDERNCVFACAVLQLARCTALPARVAAAFPPPFVDEWTRHERRAPLERALDEMLVAWPGIMNGTLTFHGIDLGPVLAPALRDEVIPPWLAAR